MKTKIASGIMATLLILGPFMISPISTADTLPRMYLVPSSATVTPGEIVTLDVYVENVNDLYAWEFKVKIDIYVVSLLKPPIEGPFLKSGGNTFFAWTYNPQSGVLMVGCTLLGLVPGVSGTGKIAEVRVIADEPGETTTVDLFDDKKYDSNFMLIPEGEPGDSEITIQWPPELWDTELRLQKIWTKYQTIGMEWDPFYNVIYVWEVNTVYCWIRNTGTAGIWVRVWLTFVSETGTTENWDPWNDIPLTTMKGYCPASTCLHAGNVVVECNCGLSDPYALCWMPDALAFESGKFNIEGQIQVSFDGLRWYSWGDFDPPLPGNGFSKQVPGEGTDMFKVFP